MINLIATQGWQAFLNMLTWIKCIWFHFHTTSLHLQLDLAAYFDPLFFSKHVCLLSSDKLAVKSHFILSLDRSVTASHTSVNILSAFNTLLAPFFFFLFFFYSFKQTSQSEAAAAILRWTRKEAETGAACQVELLPSVQALISVQHSWSLFGGIGCEMARVDRSETVGDPQFRGAVHALLCFLFIPTFWSYRGFFSLLFSAAKHFSYSLSGSLCLVPKPCVVKGIWC